MRLRTTNRVESTFATVHQRTTRTTRTTNGMSRATFLGLAFKRAQEAEKIWQRIRGIERIADLPAGMVFQDGVPTPDSPSERQQMAA